MDSATKKKPFENLSIPGWDVGKSEHTCVAMAHFRHHTIACIINHTVPGKVHRQHGHDASHAYACVLLAHMHWLRSSR